MRFMNLRLTSAVTSIAAAVAFVAPAEAACQRLGFTVNDYGKEGPTRDAKNLLDKYIAKWTAEKGITGYKTGPKSVKCELFLDVGLFDEYTCRAEATFCWDGPAVPVEKPQTADTNIDETPKAEKPKEAKATGSDDAAAESKPAKKTEVKNTTKDSAVETGSTTTSEAAPPAEVQPEPRDLGDSDPASANYGGTNPASER